MSRSVRTRCLSAELLEGRAVPAAFVVDVVGDDAAAEAAGLTLREAVALANDTDDGADSISFADELGDATITLAQGAIFLTDADPVEPISIDGRSRITVSGGGTSGVFFVVGGSDVRLRGLTVTGGVIDRGAAVRNFGSVDIIDSVITGNRATVRGGGVYSQNGGTVRVTGSTISNNSAAFDGGGLFAESGTLKITGTAVSENSAARNGGGVFTAGEALEIADSAVSGNSAAAGGGLLVFGRASKITGSAVSGNSATTGGGVFASNGAMEIVSSTVSGNSAAVNGGGVYATGGELRITGSTVSGNSADEIGGGILNNLNSLSLNNVTVVKNTAGESGGGLWTFNDRRTFTAARNSVIAGNSRPDATPDDVAGKLPDESSANNLIGDAASAGGLTDNVGGNVVGVGGSGTRPLADILDPTLADNGGPTLTHLPRGGGPLIDAGDDRAAADAGLTADQRGQPRFVGTVDIGAVELAGTAAEPGITFEGGVLRIIGTDAADRITVRRSFRDAGMLTAQLRRGDTGERVELDVEADAVARIDADGREGSDRIDVFRTLNIPSALDGGGGNDTVSGGAAEDTIVGGNGRDFLRGNGGGDDIDGGGDADRVFGDGGDDTVAGGDGDDQLYGLLGNDLIDAGAGRDRVFGQGGDDTLAGGGGDDMVYGGSGDDRAAGGAGADLLLGQAGDDTLLGESGDDTLAGGAGGDDLDGGGGDNALLD